MWKLGDLLRAIILCAVLFPGVVHGDVAGEAIVFFATEAVTLPAAQSSASIQEAQIPDPSLEALMVQWGVELLARCFPEFTSADTLRVSRTGRLVTIPDYSRVYVLTVSQTGDVDSLIFHLNGRADIHWAHLNSIEPPDQCPVTPPTACPPVASPNDEYFRSNANDSWHLFNCQTAGADVRAIAAWLFTTGSPNVTIAIVDHGVDLQHEEFIGKISGDAQIDPAFPAHGTEVASIAAANTNNACGVAALNWQARISAQYTTSESASRNSGILDAINAGADIINMSFGSYSYNETRHSLLAAAHKLDMILVSSAGNDNSSSPHYPSGHYEVLSVAATNELDQRAEWSNLGKIDVAAPGELVVLARPGNDYGFNSGTSFASPMVASLAGLLLAENPALVVEDVMGIIRSGAQDINAQVYPGTDQFLGAGRIDARAALDRLSSPYTLRHLTATTASTIQPVGNQHLHKFWHTPGLAAGTYRVQRVEYTRNVSFGALYAIPPESWGLKTTEGFYPDFNVTFGVGWAEPVPGTITRTGCVLRTYVYDVWEIAGAYLGTFPASPQDVTFDYSVLGLEDLASPSVNVVSPDGGEIFPAGSQVEIGWQVSDEYPPGIRCTVLLDREYPNGTKTVWLIASNQPVGGGGAGLLDWTIPLGQPGGDTYKIRVVAYDTNNHQGFGVSNGYFTIEGEDGGKGGGSGEPPPEPCEYPCPVGNVPYVTELLPVRPNPFSSQTQLRFTLAGSEPVALRIYDVRGRLVRTIVDGVRDRGLHELPWDGSDHRGRGLPSGVYFVELTTERRNLTRKLVIMR